MKWICRQKKKIDQWYLLYVNTIAFSCSFKDSKLDIILVYMGEGGREQTKKVTHTPFSMPEISQLVQN